MQRLLGGSRVSIEESPWAWPVDTAAYDRSASLTPEEALALSVLREEPRPWRTRMSAELAAVERLWRPLTEAAAALETAPGRQADEGRTAAAQLLLDCGTRGEPFWCWSSSSWLDAVGRSQRAFLDAHPGKRGDFRQHMVAIAYLLGCFSDFRHIGEFERVSLARKVFGSELILAAIARVQQILCGWGYAESGDRIARMLCEAFLVNRSPRLADLTPALLDALREHATPNNRAELHQLQRGLAALGVMKPPPDRPSWAPALAGVDPAWSSWVLRWEATSTLTVKTRRHARGDLLRAGRWLVDRHPQVHEPSQWTRELCAAYVAAVDRACVGDYAHRHAGQPDLGKPLAAQTKDGYLCSVRVFFRDCQEWGWIPRRFDPQRTLATPRSVKALMGPSPRVIADETWAKLMWAGLHLEEADLSPGGRYPLPMARALALAWLFSGLRSNEIARLRVGCVRWQPAHDGEQPDVCLLDVPAHKTGTPFTKPIDRLLGQALLDWQAVRPDQPFLRDLRTGEDVALLFSYRLKRVASSYLNDSIIPTLCRKAGAPRSDARGRITSHRARSTIASQLYNARDPMTLFELQAWLGHRSPASTQHYAQITPTTLTKAYTDAGYFARNLRTIAVLVDRDAIVSGAAAAGVPWQYYDLGHGHCTYNFFEQCPHRMACARCDYYVPKASTTGQLVEAKGNLQRMLVEIPLTEVERAAVEDGGHAIEQLLDRLADVPTPAGATPRAIDPGSRGIQRTVGATVAAPTSP